MNPEQLIQLFTEDIGHAQQLLELIDRESQALNARELSQLESLLDQKTPLLALLNQHAESRQRLLAEQALSADRQGLINLGQQHPEHSDSLLECADRLAELIAACQDGNNRNGQLIRINQGSVQKVLGILQGNETPSLYTNKGSSSKVSTGKPFSQA